jgi:hypothetical protein
MLRLICWIGLSKYMLVLFVVSFVWTPSCFSQASNEPVNAGVGGVGYPACVYCPKPDLPEGVRNLEDRVVVALTGVIQTNGRASDIAVVRSERTDFDKKAIETVQQEMPQIRRRPKTPRPWDDVQNRYSAPEESGIGKDKTQRHGNE